MDLEVFYNQFQELVTDLSHKTTAIHGKARNEVLYKGLVLYFFAKGWKTYQSIYLLCSKRFAEDAGILTRSLFEMTVNLLYISQRPSDRSKLFCEYGYVQKIRLHETLTKSADDEWCKRILASKSPSQLEAELKECNRVKRNYPKPTGWSGESIKKMAKEVGMSWHYDYIYLLLSGLAHTNPGAVRNYLSFDHEGTLVLQDSPQEEIDRIWRTTCIYFLLILDKMNDVFALGFEERIRTISEELKRK